MKIYFATVWALNNRTADEAVYEQHEVMCEQQCYACETNESSNGKWKGVMEQ